MDLKKRNNSKKRLIIILSVILTVLIVGSSTWLVLRATAKMPTFPEKALADNIYTDDCHVVRAVALSYFVYGCEGCDGFSGTVFEMLDNHSMGIFAENFGIVRSDKHSPETALFDTSDFVRREVGDFRCLTRLKDEKSGFFGGAFCDDDEGLIWVVYAGAITFNDYLACAGLVAAPRFTSQEKSAFELFSAVLDCDEVKTKNYSVCLAGHSLGGALATEVALASGYPAITVNGADRLAYGKIKGISGKKPQTNLVHNYVTKPDGISPMETVQRLTFLGKSDGIITHLFEKNGYTDDTHCAFSFITFSDNDFTAPTLPDEIN